MPRRALARLTAIAAGGAMLLPAAAAHAQPPHLVHASEGDLFRIDTDGSGRARLTAERGDAQDPDVSPDGTEIAYIVERNFSGQVQSEVLSVAGSDGSHRRDLATVRYDDSLHVPRWSPSGDRIAYVELDGYEVDEHIRVVEADGTDDRTLGRGGSPTWAPAGDRLAYLWGPSYPRSPGDPDTDQLRVVAPDGSDDQAVHTFEREVTPHAAAWAPRGEWVAVVVTRRSASADEPELWLISTDDGEVKRPDLPTVKSDLPSVSWTEDGERVVLEGELAGSVDGSTDAVLIDPDGEVEPRVVDAGQHDITDPVHVGRTPTGLLPVAGADGDPTTTERIAAGDGTGAAIEASRRLWADTDGGVPAEADASALPTAEHAVLSRDDVFADSLAGSALTSHGPMLFSDSSSLTDRTRAELERVLTDGATVYLLGGENALSEEVEQEVRDAGFQPSRLAGASRVETALAVADEVRSLSPHFERVVVARAEGSEGDETSAWADSVTGGAFAADAQVPVVLTQGEELHPAVRAWLDEDVPSQTLVLGGDQAISDQVADELPRAVRIAGAARDATATAIAADLWKVDPSGLRPYTVVPGYREDGWQFGLAAAGLARRADAPLLLTDGERVPAATASAVTDCQQVELVLVGDESVIPSSTATALDERDRRC